MKRRHPMSSRDHATELVESYILDMGLRPGDRLPSERDMCRMWDLNRTTLRNAIQRLVSDGVLYCRMGSGTYVAQPKLVRNLQDVKGFSEAVRETGRTPGARLVYCRQCEADKATTKRLHVSLGSPVVELCRVRTIDGVPVAMETTCLNEHLFPDIERYDFSRVSLFDVIRDEYHIQVCSGQERISITTLDEREAHLLDYPEGTPVFFQSGIIYDEKNEPVEYFKNIVLSDHIRFVSELRSEVEE